LAEKFSGGTAGARNKESGSDDEDEGGGHNKIVSDIRKKYEKKLAGPNDEVEQVSALESYLVFIVSCYYIFSSSFTNFIGRKKTGRKICPFLVLGLVDYPHRAVHIYYCSYKRTMIHVAYISHMLHFLAVQFPWNHIVLFRAIYVCVH
jgi:hypothetical protein